MVGTRVYVDLDNLYIINNRVDVHMLRKRVAAIQALGLKTVWFGNTFTSGVVRKNKIGIDVVESPVEANSSDHSLVRMLCRSGSKNALVVSADVTLCRVATYLCPGQRLAFARFRQYDLEAFDVDFCFKGRDDLAKFIGSLVMYANRYGAP